MSNKRPLNVTRNQLQDMTPNQRSLRAVEQLIQQVNQNIPDDIQSAILDALSGGAAGRKAADAVSRLADRVALEAGIANGKADKVASELRRIATALEIQASYPPVAKTNKPSADVIDFANRNANPPAHREGRLFYDPNDFALSYYNEDNDVTVTLGREMLVRAFNNTGTTINNGEVLYINGANSNYPTVARAIANSAAGSQSTIGLATSIIENGTFGYVCISGTVNGLNTSAYAPGTLLYLSASTPGGVTSTAPLQPNYAVEIGIVASSSLTQGRVQVAIQKIQWFPSLEVLDTSASVILPTIPTVYVAPSIAYDDGFLYDTTTGILTTLNSRAYSITIQFNALPSAANKNIYFYVEEDTGAGFQIKQYSARQLELKTGTEEQLVIPASRYYPAFTRLRFYVWGDSTVTLKTTDLPGTAPGTVTKPAFRITIAG